MKKFLSIAFALLILFSGMHLSLATHTCGGEIASVKWSVTGEKASCGMEKPQTCPLHATVTSDCCEDRISTYGTDTDYGPSFFQWKNTSVKLMQVFTVPVAFLWKANNASNPSCAESPPRDKLPITAVRLEAICVFRI